MLTWHLREETFRSALACLTDAIHAEPLAAWFGEGWRANADGQAYHLGGPGEAGGSINAHYAAFRSSRSAQRSLTVMPRSARR